MNDRAAAVLAVAVGVAAWSGVRGISLLLPWGRAAPWVVVAVVVALVLVGVVGALHGAPWMVLVALCLVAGVRGHDAGAALAEPPPPQVEGVAELVDDPDAGRFDVRVILRLDGRRYAARVPNDRAGPLAELLTGERVRVSGTTAPLDEAPVGWVLSRHLAGRLNLRSVEPAGDAAPWYRLANGLHRTITAGSSSFDGDHRALYLGLVMGDDREQSELTEHRFRASGLTHLLAVSGQNVAFVLAVLAPLIERLGRRTRSVVAVSVLVVFVLVTRADPSVLRASVMAGLAILAVTTGRVAPTTRLLCLAVAGLLVVDPLLVHSVGFQLSVCATGGLLVLGRPVARRLRGPDWFVTPLAVTVAAQLATAPVLVALSDGIPSVATLANLFAGPAAGGVMMLGVAVGGPAGLVHESIAAVVQAPARLLVAWVELVASVSSRSGLVVLTPARLVLLVVAAVSGWLVHRATRRGGVAALGWCCVAALVLAAMWPTGPPPGEHELGPSGTLVVGACGGTVVLVTGGRSVRRLDRLAHLGVRRIDLVVTSGRDRRAVEDLAAQFEVREHLDVRDHLDAGHQFDGIDHAGRPIARELGGVVVDVDPLTGAATVEPSGESGRCRVG